MSKRPTRRDFLRHTAAGGVVASTLARPVYPQATITIDKPLRLGFVGVGRRGSFHLDIALGIKGIEIPALCDINEENLHRAKGWVEHSGRPSPTLYGGNETDFERMCERESLDCVICCTPWKWHAPCCLSAMRNDKHAVSEIPIVQTLDEAWEIVECHEKTGKWATLALEGLGNLPLLNLIRKGLLGNIVHAEGGYLHDLRQLKFDPERQPWRLQHSISRNGNLYPDHPMRSMIFHLDINHGDRIDYLVSMSSRAQSLNAYAAEHFGQDHPYAKLKMSQGDYNASLIRTVLGKMITLNFDTNTPHPRGIYRIQGTRGVYMRDFGSDESQIYLDQGGVEGPRWESAEPYLERYTPQLIKDYAPPQRRGARGYGGLATWTPFTWHRLVRALSRKEMPDWDVYDSVTSSSISPLSEISVKEKSRPVDFPDFTRGKWKENQPVIIW